MTRRDRAEAVAALMLLALAVPSSLLAQGRKFDEFTNTHPLVGELAPDFTLPTVDGEQFTLSEAYAERPVVIEFGSYT